MRLFVNGEMVAAAPMRGEIALPKEGTPFVAGAYKDDDEFFPLIGRVAEVVLRDGPVPAERLAELRKQSDGLAFTVQPRVAFPAPGEAVISWQAASGEAVLFHGAGKELAHEVKCDGPEGRFEAKLTGLDLAEEYS